MHEYCLPVSFIGGLFCVVIFLEGIHMEDYINRLVRCGYAHYTAYNICHSFMREFGLKELLEFIESIERDNSENVD